MVMWYTWTLYSHGGFCSRTLNHALLFCRTPDLKFLVRLTSYVTESLQYYTFFSYIRHVIGNDAPIPHFSRVFQSILAQFLCRYDHISGFWPMTFLLTFISSGSKLESWRNIHGSMRRSDIISSNKNHSPPRISSVRDYWSGQCRSLSD